MMRWQAKINNPLSVHFVIHQDNAAGFYLYLYWGELDLMDYLQDTLAIAMDQAESEFNVPKTAWRLADGQTTEWIADSEQLWNMRLVIEADADRKFHVRILGNGRNLYDYPAATLASAQKFVLDKLNVPLDVWQAET